MTRHRGHDIQWGPLALVWRVCDLRSEQAVVTRKQGRRAPVRGQLLQTLGGRELGMSADHRNPLGVGGEWRLTEPKGQGGGFYVQQSCGDFIGGGGRVARWQGAHLALLAAPSYYCW